ncbi:DUF29 domain-containing protein [Aerosakkonemataceae cyanobacterium BLCC-F50]|uniref:DUF29 domain-containing protein n=1 Tax=Floridaenema flaviceps BLCC-F50 TaxID=3153642 RepID=A0ABV4Y484_9CYAN
MLDNLYNSDYDAWVAEQIQHLKFKALEKLDIDHLISELEGMGKSDRRSLESNLRILLAHLLKWKYQPEKRSGSWRGTIKEHRRRCLKILFDSPSLKNHLSTVLNECYTDAKDLAATETELPGETFPNDCPFSIDEILNPEFLPEN